MKRKLGTIFLILIMALVVFFAFHGIDFNYLYTLMLGINVWFFILACVAYLVTFLFGTLRIKYFLEGFCKSKFSFLFNVFFATAFFNNITPGAGVGGEPFKAYLLSKKYKKSNSKFFGIILGEKFFHLLVLVLFVLFSFLFVFIYVKIPSNLKLILEIVLIFILVLFGITIFFIFKKMNFKLGVIFKKLFIFGFIKRRFETAEHFEKYVDKKISEFYKIFRKVVRDKRKVKAGIIFSFFYWIVFFLVSYFLFLAFGVHVNFLSVIVVVTLGMLLGLASPLPGGFGIIEGSMVLLYSAMGIDFHLSLLVSFLSRIIYYFFNLVVGGLTFIYLKMTLSSKEDSFF